MNGVSRTFDWLAFLTRLTVIVALTTCLLIDRLHRSDRIGVALVAGVGYIILPVVAYIHTRYFNSILMDKVVRALRRKPSDAKTTRHL